VLGRTDEFKRKRIESLYRRSQKAFPEIDDLTVEEFQAVQGQDNILLVDVRPRVEQEVSMIPGAIPVDHFLQDRDQYQGATVVTYCTLGGRSGRFASELHADGWKVFNLRGAILAWTHARGPLCDASGHTLKVHVYSRKFSLAAEGYEPVW
jgi:rhodanese-related sulfurtransferase